MRMRRPIARHDRHEQAINDRVDRADGDPPLLPGVRPPRRFHPLREHRERAARIGEEVLPRLGERHAPPATHEERPADLCLQRLHPATDRRLRHIEGARGAIETALTDDPLEGHELLPVHAVALL